MTTKIPMTPDGHARLSAELRRLKTEERPAVIKAIAAAASTAISPRTRNTMRRASGRGSSKAG